MVKWICITWFTALITTIGSCTGILSESADGLPVLPTAVLEDVYSGSVFDDVYSPGTTAPLPPPAAGKPADRVGGMPELDF
ncbi:hypothetical protein AB6A23_10480 [Paenibacillus tarimensis]